MNFTDLLNTEADFDESQKILQKMVRDFVEQEVKPHIASHFEKATFDRAIIKKLGSLGLLGSNLSGYGCAGVDPVSYGIIMKELERGDSALRSFASVQGSLAMYAIHRFGSEAQKQRWLPLLAAGEAVGCFGLTEPDFGSNPSGMRTTAVRKGNNWILNGSKTWITNAPLADVCVVWAQAADEGILGFLVERSQAGLDTPEIEHKLSLRASVTGSIFLKDCLVSEEQRLPLAKGVKAPLSCLTQARYGICWGVIGAAEDCLQEAVAYAQQRLVFGRPLAATQLCQQKLAQCAIAASAAQTMAMQLAHHKEANTLFPYQVSTVKQFNCKMAIETARICRDILGANGISLEYRAMRHAVNLESVFTYEGTNDIHLLIVGQHLTGHSAFGNEA